MITAILKGLGIILVGAVLMLVFNPSRAASVALPTPATCTSVSDAAGNVTIVCTPAATPVPPIPPIPPVSPCTINLTFPWVFTVNKVVPMGPNDTISIKLVVTPTASTYSSITGGEWATPAANRTYTLSTQPCDFGAGIGGFPRTSSSVSVLFAVGKTVPGVVTIAPGTYYLNIKNTAPVTPVSHQMFFNVAP